MSGRENIKGQQEQTYAKNVANEENSCHEVRDFRGYIKLLDDS